MCPKSRKYMLIQGKERNGNVDFPDDLIIEILLRLPPKALCKFRCVSKLWYHLLTNNKEFIFRHIEWSKKNPILLMKRYILDENGEMNKNKATVELTSVDMNGNVTDKFKVIVEGFVNTFISCGPLSILCCAFSLYICNPSFHEFVRVPFSSRTRLQNIGVGYLPISSEYKIVNVFEDYYSMYRSMVCEILTFKNGEKVISSDWRRRSVFCPWSAYTEKYPLCVDGNIYWARSSGGNNRSIMSFDLEKEDFSIIDYPLSDSKKYSFMEFTGIKGSLYVIGSSVETSTMDVWFWDKHEKIWLIKHCINFFPFVVNFVVSSDNESEDILMHTEQKGLISYNIKNRTSRKIKYFEGVRSFNKPCLYYYSLSSLHKITQGQ